MAAFALNPEGGVPGMPIAAKESYGLKALPANPQYTSTTIISATVAHEDCEKILANTIVHRLKDLRPCPLGSFPPVLANQIAERLIATEGYPAWSKSTIKNALTSREPLTEASLERFPMIIGQTIGSPFNEPTSLAPFANISAAESGRAGRSAADFADFLVKVPGMTSDKAKAINEDRANEPTLENWATVALKNVHQLDAYTALKDPKFTAELNTRYVATYTLVASPATAPDYAALHAAVKDDQPALQLAAVAAVLAPKPKAGAPQPSAASSDLNLYWAVYFRENGLSRVDFALNVATAAQEVANGRIAANLAAIKYNVPSAIMAPSVKLITEYPANSGKAPGFKDGAEIAAWGQTLAASPAPTKDGLPTVVREATVAFLTEYAAGQKTIEDQLACVAKHFATPACRDQQNNILALRDSGLLGKTIPAYAYLAADFAKTELAKSEAQWHTIQALMKALGASDVLALFSGNHSPAPQTALERLKTTADGRKLYHNFMEQFPQFPHVTAENNTRGTNATTMTSEQYQADVAERIKEGSIQKEIKNKLLSMRLLLDYTKTAPGPNSAQNAMAYLGADAAGRAAMDAQLNTPQIAGSYSVEQLNQFLAQDFPPTSPKEVMRGQWYAQLINSGLQDSFVVGKDAAGKDIDVGLQGYRGAMATADATVAEIKVATSPEELRRHRTADLKWNIWNGPMGKNVMGAAQRGDRLELNGETIFNYELTEMSTFRDKMGIPARDPKLPKEQDERIFLRDQQDKIVLSLTISDGGNTLTIHAPLQDGGKIFRGEKQIY